MGLRGVGLDKIIKWVLVEVEVMGVGDKMYGDGLKSK